MYNRCKSHHINRRKNICHVGDQDNKAKEYASRNPEENSYVLVEGLERQNFPLVVTLMKALMQIGGLNNRIQISYRFWITKAKLETRGKNQ